MKNIYRNIVFSGLGYILPLLVSLATIPLMINLMGDKVYGLYAICVSLIGFMAFVDLGVGQAVIKYVAQYEATGENTKVKPVLDIALTLYVGLGIVLAALLAGFSTPLGGWFQSDSNDKGVGVDPDMAATAIAITALAFLLGYVNQFFLNVFRAYHRFDIPAVIQNTANIVGVVQATVLLLLGYELILILWGYVAIQALALAAGFTFGRKILPAGVGLGFAFDRQIFAEMIGFSSYTFVSNFLGGVVSRLDKLIIGAALGTDAVTYYQVPHTIAQMANGLIQVLSQITFPRFSELSGVNDHAGRLALYKRSLLLVFVGSMVINVALISAGKAFLTEWISADFAAHSAVTLQIIALYFFFQSNTVIAYWALQGAGSAKVTALSSAMGTVAYMVGMFFLMDLYGHNGAAMSLFLLMLPLPYFYLSVQRNVGHKFGEYVLLSMAFLVLGALLVFLLGYLHGFIASNILTIVVDGVVLASMIGVALLFFSGKSSALLPVRNG